MSTISRSRLSAKVIGPRLDQNKQAADLQLKGILVIIIISAWRHCLCLFVRLSTTLLKKVMNGFR